MDGGVNSAGQNDLQEQLNALAVKAKQTYETFQRQLREIEEERKRLLSDSMKSLDQVEIDALRKKLQLPGDD